MYPLRLSLSLRRSRTQSEAKGTAEVKGTCCLFPISSPRGSRIPLGIPLTPVRNSATIFFADLFF